MKGIISILLFTILANPLIAFADEAARELAGLEQWARTFGIQMTSEPQFAKNAEKGSWGYSLPTVTVQINSGLTCFYHESSTNYIRSSRPDWYMSCGPRLFHNEGYIKRYPKCGTYDYTQYLRSVNCFRNVGTDSSQAVQCYQSGRAGAWHRINCLRRSL
jgi:hypothetical protein